ncbi:hypothetical protein [Erythrobacter cryptus]|uniref:hypothetical protein n=1 Tax=Erythrobacter cryptus TaxID=196588 RepID=UPI001FE0081E|nr:hypothetical protein [Erythrobacter cryptus]
MAVPPVIGFSSQLPEARTAFRLHDLADFVVLQGAIKNPAIARAARALEELGEGASESELIRLALRKAAG